MNKYIVSYGAVKLVRWANTATEAIHKLCEQYDWSYDLRMYDSDTRGNEWCVCMIDKKGGINYTMRILAPIENA